MKTIARIVTRLQGENDGLFLGALMDKNQTVFKPNTIYEVVECYGQILIREVGQAGGAGENNCASNMMAEGKTLFHWAQDIGDIIRMHGAYLFLTLKEIIEQRKQRNAEYSEEL